jgi:3-hydroxybenzoate 6-monooxygenase
VHRGDLHGVLLKACQDHPLIELRVSSEVAGYDQDGASVTARLVSGDTVTGRLLIGADGLWSNIRKKVVGDGAPRVSGHIAYRAVLKREDVPDDLWRPDVVLWAGPKTHFVHYPLRRGTLYNLVAVFHSDRYVEGWNSVGDPEELFKRFKGQRPEVLRLLERIETWRMWVLCDREPVKHWSKGRVTLLGDAAHPMLQYMAQGACMAMEDAVCLADSLSRTDTLESGLASYLDRRVLRTTRLQLMSRAMGDHVYHPAGPHAALRNAIMTAKSQAEWLGTLEWLYGGNGLD